jgi:pyruvate/2-oxoglutarate dehydrogenase complex dihydrolipoamide dehydrogenase (E3) component
VLSRLRDEGVGLIEQDQVTEAGRHGTEIRLRLQAGPELVVSHLLVAVGRAPIIEGLGLAAAGVDAGPDGIRVDARRRTSNRRIFAIGDCREGPRLTHLAAEEGSVVVRNIALGWPARIELGALPRVIFTDPELAQLGAADEGQTSGGGVSIERQQFDEDDRAVTEGDTAGFVKLMHAARRVAGFELGRRLVGVTIVGRGAGEMLLPWSLVLRGRASLFGLAGMVVAYPTRSERSRAAAFASYEGVVFSTAVKRWVAMLAWIRRLGLPS